MIASANPASDGRRDNSGYARSVIVVLGRSILAAMIGALCVVRVATADPAALRHADYEGRWVSEKLTLDISRCGEGLCGVEVLAKACGRTMLRVSEGKTREGVVLPQDRFELLGKLQLAANTEPYGVIATLRRQDNGAMMLMIAGHTGGKYSAFRRMYDYKALLARSGEALCRPDPKIS
jgi:uncharacterized protein (DUF2147 family)